MKFKELLFSKWLLLVDNYLNICCISDQVSKDWFGSMEHCHCSLILLHGMMSSAFDAAVCLHCFVTRASTSFYFLRSVFV